MEQTSVHKTRSSVGGALFDVEKEMNEQTNEW